MIASQPFKNAFLPNRPIDKKIALLLVAAWLGLALAIWVASPFESLPRPGEVWKALGEMWWGEGMGPELFTTLRLIFHSLAITIAISLAPSARR